MNLIVDIGNTLAKCALIKDNKIIEVVQDAHENGNVNLSFIENVLKRYPAVEKGILSSVAGKNKALCQNLKKKVPFFIELGHNTPIPFQNLYDTPKTLGKDRIAGVAGAKFLFPGNNCLVIDAGSAITFDFLNAKGQYVGGNISPGLSMRFTALNQFTQRLPLLAEDAEQKDRLGKSTNSAIILGVQNGMKYEIEGYIHHLESQYNDLKCILTGGNSIFFDKILKKTIFVQPKLIAIGLNFILEYNVKNQ